jgi:hypothetical protein
MGTDNEELLKDSFYAGLWQRRVGSPKYDNFLDEFMEAIPSNSRFCI